MVRCTEIKKNTKLLLECPPKMAKKFGIPIWHHRLGTPCNCTISLKYTSATWEESTVLLQGIKCDIFENQSTTTITESLPLCVLGSPITKSKLTYSQGAFGTGKRVYNPAFWLLSWPLNKHDNAPQI